MSRHRYRPDPRRSRRLRRRGQYAEYTPAPAWSGHVVILSADISEDEDDFEPCLGGVRYELHCTHPERCSGWAGCPKTRCRLADRTPEDFPEFEDWYDEVERTSHGQVHTYRPGWGWTVPAPDCVVVYNVTASGNSEIIDDLYLLVGSGVHAVDDEWLDETDVTLYYRGPSRWHVTRPRPLRGLGRKGAGRR